MMGILPDVARDLGISIATAGHLISAYALGVCIGAPMLILALAGTVKVYLDVFGGSNDAGKYLCSFSS